MDKSKKPQIQKTLLRNVELPKPKVLVVEERKQFKPKKRLPKPPPPSNVDFDPKQHKFDSPEFNTALEIKKRIENVERIKPKFKESKKVVELAVDDKVTRKINFPYDKYIYKDLIPLCPNGQREVVNTTSREPLPKKDPQPNLSDFFTPKVLQEYSYQPPIQTHQKSMTTTSDCLKLYRTIENWKSNL